MILSNKLLYKGEIAFTKYLPIIISLLYLDNTLCSYYYKEVPEFSFLGGTSFIIICRMYWSSYTFKLCRHHRVFIHFILLNNILDYIDYCVDGLPISDRGNLLLEIVLFGITLILYIIFKRHYDFSVKNGSKVFKRYC